MFQRLQKLEKRSDINFDVRLSYWSPAMAKSTGKHSEASKQIKQLYGGVCIICGDVNATMAHIVAGNKDVDYAPFGKPYYKDDLDVKSSRNFLPLCGHLGAADTCHNEFNKYLMTILFNPFESSYKVFCFNPQFAKYNTVHNTVINVSAEHPPYLRLLAWRTRMCLNSNLHMISANSTTIDTLLELANFSEQSKSIASRRINDSEEDLDSISK